VKVGDLVIITSYGSRHAPNGTMGVIVKELPLTGPSSDFHQAYHVQCQNGHIAHHADFCLEVISESR
jgi:hypothetical protein